MAYRDGRSMTGSNTIPLGGGLGIKSVSRAAMGGGGESLLNPSYLTLPNMKREPGAEKRPADEDRESRSETREDRKKKRRSRWEAETEKIVIPGIPTTIPAGLTKDQEEAYLLQLKIEETSRRLRSGDLGIPANPEDRSPSPEPIYGGDGKRVNTREFRKRKELEEQRHEAIQRMLIVNPEYKPPVDYRPVMTRVSDKVMIPQDLHPEINFVGLLIGPRGNTLKMMEKETGAKIIIRGKGSVKEGKVARPNGQPLPGEDEPLHAYITATDPEAVRRAVNKVKEVITEGVEVPEDSNELRKMQLRELALLNGTLRDDISMVRCTNCGSDAHRSWQCQDKPNVTNTVNCHNCGGVGHIASDCKQRRGGGVGGGDSFRSQAGGGAKMDLEYMSLMAELGEGPPPAPSAPGGVGNDWQGGNRSGPGHMQQRGGGGPPGPPRAIMGPSGGGGGILGSGPGGPGGWNQRPPGPRPDFQHQSWSNGGGGGGGNWGSGPGGPARGPPPPGPVPPPPGNWMPPGGPPPPHGHPQGGFGAPPPRPGFPMSGPPPQQWNPNMPPPNWGVPPPSPVPPPSGNWGPGQWAGPGAKNPLQNLLGAPPPPPPPPS